MNSVGNVYGNCDNVTYYYANGMAAVMIIIMRMKSAIVMLMGMASAMFMVIAMASYIAMLMA